MFALALPYHDRGLGRISGIAIIAGYLAFVTALLTSVAQGKVSPAVAALSAVGMAAAGALLLRRSPARGLCWHSMMSRSHGWGRESLLPGWSVGRLWKLSFIPCSAVAACDAASGPRLILIGLLIVGPCCALLTGRWALTAAASCFAYDTGYGPFTTGPWREIPTEPLPIWSYRLMSAGACALLCSVAAASSAAGGQT